MFKFLNKELYVCIFLNTEESKSTYITQIKTHNSPTYENLTTEEQEADYEVVLTK